MKFTDEAIIAELKNVTELRELCFAEIYRRHFSSVEAYVLKNNGSGDDAKDIFQDVMIVLLAKVNEQDFKLKSSLGTYLYAIARNLWLNKLKQNGRMALSGLTDDIPEEALDENQSDQENSLARWIGRITERCQQIIRSLFFLIEPMETVSNRFRWKNKHTAQNQKYKCIQQIKKVKDEETVSL